MAATPTLRIGYLGLGIMGEACARNLLKSGLFASVHVWNRNSAKVIQLEYRIGASLQEQDLKALVFSK